MKIILSLILALFPLASFASFTSSDFILGDGYYIPPASIIINSSNNWSSAFYNKPKTSGVWYWESTIISQTHDYMFGIASPNSSSLNTYLGSDLGSYSYAYGMYALNNGALIGPSFSSNMFSSGVVVGILMNLDNDTLTFTRNGVFVSSFSISDGTFFPAFSFLKNSVGSSNLFINFGDYDFFYPPSSSFSTFLEKTPSLPSPSCQISGSVNAPITQNSPLCSVGTVSNFSSLGSSPISYTWSCVSGTSVSCGATYTPPAPITGYFDTPVSVSSGSYNWNLLLHLSTGAIVSDSASIQLWNQFKINSITPNSDNTQITFSLSSYDSNPLNVDCSVYTMTVPSSLLQGVNGTTANESPIIASFSVVGCPTGGNNSDSGSTNSGITSSGLTLADSGTYLIFGQSHNGVLYINSDSIVYLILALSLFLAISYGLFRMVIYLLTGKTSIVGKR